MTTTQTEGSESQGPEAQKLLRADSLNKQCWAQLLRAAREWLSAIRMNNDNRKKDKKWGEREVERGVGGGETNEKIAITPHLL